MYFTERLRPANRCQKKKKGKGKKRTSSGSQNVSNNMEAVESADANMQEMENFSNNVEKMEHVETSVPRDPWLSALNQKQKASLLYSIGYLTFEHDTKAKELKDVVSKMGGEKARIHFSNVARSKLLKARRSSSS